MFQLRLYIIKQTPRSGKIIRKLKKTLDDKSNDQYSLEIISVLDNPERADQDMILATPTLIRVSPEPKKRIIGDFSSSEKLLTHLEMRQKDM